MKGGPGPLHGCDGRRVQQLLRRQDSMTRTTPMRTLDAGGPDHPGLGVWLPAKCVYKPDCSLWGRDDDPPGRTHGRRGVLAAVRSSPRWGR